MEKVKPFRWRFVILVTLGVGISMGALIAVLQSAFGITVPTILGGLLSGVIIAVIVVLAGQREE